MTPDDLKALIRTIPDFPKAGIQFRDITTLLGHGPGFAASVRWLAGEVEGVEAIAGMEARGFIFGAAVAARLGLPFLPIRKPGKLPCEVIGVDYELEYGVDRLEMDPTAIARGQNVAIVDDLLATGGTALAATELLRKAGAAVGRAAFVIDLPDLGGSARLAAQSVDVRTLMDFDGD
ncbi:adenine phosphoribosyltransferase [Qipengyuania qiaonensis]|uniref:Adenine phosphoribosyltransferase n=1 Tax=Qipengyuania qiaonensis TaxID=2867240 RepID=A0ABS7J4T4_9SPHN|nr:adenine phosphoribosyltransferase [Qipengyuania qiaonensis]MBX7482348.1 adenine phosphoribosyltransferase [Qipengyuania qiaonensis]